MPRIWDSNWNGSYFSLWLPERNFDPCSMFGPPATPEPLPHISRFYSPLLDLLKIIKRRFEMRCEPRWRSTRWKAKT